jgi:hypothetical protein
MAKEKQRTVTLSGEKGLRILERRYKKELDKSVYRISFAQFLMKHAIENIERIEKEGVKEEGTWPP